MHIPLARWIYQVKITLDEHSAIKVLGLSSQAPRWVTLGRLGLIGGLGGEGIPRWSRVGIMTKGDVLGGASLAPARAR